MKLVSEIELNGFPYYIILNDLKGAQNWYLYSRIHPKNYSKIGEDRMKDSIDLQNLMITSCDEYLIEGLSRSKKTGKTKVFKRADNLNKILRAFIDSRDLSYPKDSIYENNIEFDDSSTRTFEARFKNYYIRYSQVDNLYTDLRFRFGEIEVGFAPNNFIKLPKKLEYKEANNETKLAVEVVSIEKVDVEVLKSLTDLSWYMDLETGEKKKDYRSITTIHEFEQYFITPMIRSIKNEIKRGIRPLATLDTETSGFNLLMLDDANPDKDHISTIQFCWKEDQGVIIYLDMQYFDNISKDYVLSRLYDMFKYGSHDVSITLIRDEDGNEINEVVTFNRKEYDLCGHNSMFDSRVTLSEGYQYFFDEDTLQMAFNINPITIKKDKGLKQLTRYFFGHETPELKDILGKGNEDKFRFLSSREVTEIYGCADVDYTRKIWFKLRELMSDKMYRAYKKLDPMTWFLGAQSEYYGMNLDEEHVSKYSKIIQEDMKIIKELIYKYVGAVLKKRVDYLSEGVNSNDLRTSESLEGDEEILLGDSDRYEFKLAGDDVRRVMYKLLKYPVKVYSEKTHQPAVNSDAITKLLFIKNKGSSHILKEDVYSSEPPDKNGKKTTLIDAQKFNSYRYPLCYLLQEYSKWNKEFTTYYKPFENEDLEGRLFKRISTTNIETRRISSPAQIIKKNLKKAVISHGEDWYLADWDLNQVEARIFTSEAGDQAGIKRLKDPENDYHTENAAMMYEIPPHLVSKDSRKKAKSIGFGIPYGLSDYKLCERLFTIHNDENDFQTRKLRKLFEDANRQCMDYLNGIRDKALEPVDVPIELKRFWGVPDDSTIGMAKNKDGFYRYFLLDNVLGDKQKEESVRRAAGNYPTQSFAADLFRFLLIRFYDTLVKNGLEKKVIFHMYIHDELLFSVHKSVDPRLIAKLCSEACMVTLKGHTKYFIGLNFGKSWYECKKDENEIPTKFLMEIEKNFDSYELQEWTDDPMALMSPLIDDYKKRRVLDVIKQYEPNLGNDLVDLNKLIDEFHNYSVRSYIYDNKKSYEPRKRLLKSTGKEETDDNDVLFSSLCTLLSETGYKDSKFKIDDSIYTVEEYIALRKESSSVSDLSDTEIVIEDEEDEDLDFGDRELSFYSFDESESFDDHVMQMWQEDYVDEFDFTPTKDKFDYVKKSGKVITAKCSKGRDLSIVIEYLDKYKDPNGLFVFVETPLQSIPARGKFDLNLKDLNTFLTKLNGGK